MNDFNTFINKYKDTHLEDKEINKILNYYSKISTNDDNYETYFEKYFIMCEKTISIEDYLKRLIMYLDISKNLIVVSSIYIDRLKIKFNYNYFHKIILISLLVTNKFLEDDNMNNKFWADCGGVTINIINKLEIKFLIKINYNLFIEENEFCKKYNEIFSD
jgi:hypothetical protein